MNSQSPLARAYRPFGTSIFTEMSQLADSHRAINLSQGFPDFDGPRSVRQAAAEAILRGPNQYSPSMGLPALRQAVAHHMARFYQVEVDPQSEVTICGGASECLAAALLGLLDPGDEAILLEPYYDLYAPNVMRAGAEPVFVSLQPPEYALPHKELAAAFGPRTKLIIINNPQNPSGKVFSRQELAFIAGLCLEHDAYAISDEVYEHLVYDGHRHHTLLSLPELRGRAIVISSTAKTFSMTGWKVGWAVACPELSQAVRMSHQFITFATPGCLQEAMAGALAMDDEYYRDLLGQYTARRDLLCGALAEMGLAVLVPQGSYYCSLDIRPLGYEDDVEFCRFLTREVGVAAIPNSAFYHQRRGGRHLARLCFCKKDETLRAAIGRLARWRADA